MISSTRCTILNSLPTYAYQSGACAKWTVVAAAHLPFTGLVTEVCCMWPMALSWFDIPGLNEDIHYKTTLENLCKVQSYAHFSPQFATLIKKECWK